MIRPCEQTDIVRTGKSTKTIKTYSYVALLCEKDGSEVKAIRYDGYTSKYDLRDSIIENEHLGWKCKGVWRLYDSDFEA